jgi:hypothetical protein
MGWGRWLTGAFKPSQFRKAFSGLRSKPQVQPAYDYEADRIAKLKADRERKNKRNRRGRAQTQGDGLGAVSNILGG